MKKRAVSQWRMIATTLNFLGEKVEGKTNVERLEAAIGELREQIGHINETVDQRRTLERGRTQTRDTLRKQLAEQAHILASVLTSLATDRQDEELLVRMSFRESRWQYGPLNTVLADLRQVNKTAQANAEALKSYGVTEEQLAIFGNQIEQFAQLITAPRDMIAARKALTARLYEQIDEALLLLERIIDPLIVGLQDESIKNEYNARRMIVDPASRPKSEEEQQQQDEF